MKSWVLLLGLSIQCGLNAGVLTLVTHGYNSHAQNGGWVHAMADAISNYPRKVAEYGYGTTPIYRLYFSEGRLYSQKVSGPAYRDSSSGDAVLMLDWNPYSGSLWINEALSTETVGDYVAGRLAADSALIPELNGVATRFPLHLIGHSRGGSLVCEIAKGLGTRGVYVDQLTLLDAHPVGNDGFDSFLESLAVGVTDGTALRGVYENVFFSDAYYQTLSTFSPQGTGAFGAYNRKLDPTLDVTDGYNSFHSNAHLWYYCTIADSSPLPTSNGEASLTFSGRNRWYSQSEDLGRKAGYFASERGGGLSVGSHFAAGINGRWLKDLGLPGDPNNRSSINGVPVQFANVIDIGITAENEERYSDFSLGAPIKFKIVTAGESGVSGMLFYQAYSEGDAIIRLFADNDENVANGVTKEVSYSVPATGSKYAAQKGLLLDDLIAGLKPAVYRVGIEIRKGTSVKRHRYASDRLLIVPRLRCDWVPTQDNGIPAFNVVIRGLRDKRFAIEASADLGKWSAIATGQLRSSSATELEGVDAWNQISKPAESVQFFRVRYLD